MSFRSIVAAIVFALAAVLPCGAATIYVLVLEAGLGSDAPSVEASSAWEAGLMDGFFDTGHIVYNAEIERVEQTALPVPAYGMHALREGGADFLILMLLDYTTAPAAATASAAATAPAAATTAGGGAAIRVRNSPRSIRYRLVSATGTVLLETERLDLPPSRSGAEDAGYAKELARSLSARMKDR
jgi:hypothetical protein